MLADAYVLPPAESVDSLFDPDDDVVQQAVLVRLTPQQSSDAEIRKQLAAAYPRADFGTVRPGVRADWEPYCLYLTGMALLLCGGSGWFVWLYAALAQRVRWRVFRSPLEELSRHRRLLWAMHLVYFGLVIAGALVIYSMPQLQNAMLGMVHSAFADGTGPIGATARAYSSKNMAAAAGMTLALNFLAGSLLVITAPSIILPGVGGLTAAFRGLMWGIVLAPTIGVPRFRHVAPFLDHVDRRRRVHLGGVLCDAHTRLYLPSVSGRQCLATLRTRAAVKCPRPC